MKAAANSEVLRQRADEPACGPAGISSSFVILSAADPAYLTRMSYRIYFQIAIFNRLQPACRQAGSGLGF